jgi:hypothetical protein
MWMGQPERINFALDAPASRGMRHLAALNASPTRADGSILELTISDLSHDGCGVLTPVALQPGERLDLAVIRRGRTPALVRWYAGGRAGLAFAAEATDGAREHVPRRHERISAEGEVTMRRSGKLPFRVHIYDLTPGGCRAEFVERPELHERLWIKFDQLEAQEAQVRWIAGPRTGL